MIQKMLAALVFLTFVIAVGGFAVLAVWDVPVVQKEVEKPVDTSKLLGKKP